MAKGIGGKDPIVQYGTWFNKLQALARLTIDYSGQPVANSKDLAIPVVANLLGEPSTTEPSTMEPSTTLASELSTVLVGDPSTAPAFAAMAAELLVAKAAEPPTAPPQ